MGELLANYDVLGAFIRTIQLTIFSAIGALILGTLVAVMRVSPVPLLEKLGALYVNTVRNTPLTLVVTFFAFVVVTQFRIELGTKNFNDNSFRWAIVGLAVYHASLVCEALRSGINTVPPGQAEAARSIGLTFGQNLRYVVLPQAFRGAIAPLGNTLIALTKNTTVVSAVSVAEASQLMSEMFENDSDKIVMIFILFAVGFVILTLPLGLIFTSMSRRLVVKR